MSKVFVFGHRNPDTDAIGAAIGLAHLEAALGSDVEAVALGRPSLETAFALDHFGLDAPRVIETAAPAEVMLVDHNERQQSVADITDVTVLKVIDHHRIANFETAAPLYMRVEPVGCTCTILTRMYAENGVEIPRPEAGIMLSAIISDTLLFNSPTCTDADRAAAAELANEEVRQDLRQPSRGHAHRKSAQEGIAQRNLGTAAQAVLEGDHGGIKPHAGHEPADDGTQEESHHHMHAQKGEHEHDYDGDENCIHA